MESPNLMSLNLTWGLHGVLSLDRMRWQAQWRRPWWWANGEIWLWPTPQKKPFLPNLTCVHTQGSFCGFGCNPIYTLADLELGLAVIAHQDDGVNSLGFKEVTDQVIFSLRSQSWLVGLKFFCWMIFVLISTCWEIQNILQPAWLLLFKAVKTLNYRLKQHMLQTEVC